MEIFTVSLVVVCIILFCVCIILFCVNVAEGKKLKDTKRLVELEEDVAKSLAHEYEKKKIEYEHKVSRSKELDEEYFEKQKILRLINEGLSYTQIAEALQISRSTLYRRLQNYQIRKDLLL